MTFLRKTAGAAVVAALLATSAAPAAARRPGGWNGGGWGGHHGDWRPRRDRGGISGGDVLAGVLILGGIAAIATAAKKDQDRKRTDRYPDRGYPDNRSDGPDDYADTASEDAAVDACALAAEDRAGERGDRASVREILRVDPANEGWRVEGLVETRRGYRDDHPDRQRFTCSYRYGQVQSVQIDSGIAYR